MFDDLTSNMVLILLVFTQAYISIAPFETGVESLHVHITQMQCTCTPVLVGRRFAPS